jgi:hypothetical protein
MAKKPAPDSIYQNALNNFKRLKASAWNTFNNTKNQNVLNRNQQFNTLNVEKPLKQKGIRDDFTGRGMLFSTRQAEDQNNYLKDWMDRQGAVTRNYDQSNNSNEQSRIQTIDSIKMQQEQARLDWIARRAAARRAQ